jgi:hypothetical protein
MFRNTIRNVCQICGSKDEEALLFTAKRQDQSSSQTTKLGAEITDNE